jgi:hypothetical protein
MACVSAEEQRAFLICDGGLAGLIATAYEAERWGRASDAGARAEPPLVWSGHVQGIQAAQAAAAASLFGLTHLAQPTQAGLEELGSGGAASAVLLTAGYVAASHGCERIVWPVQVGAGTDQESAAPNLDALARAVDRALLVSRVVALDAHEHGRPAVRIETPFADLSDRQLADLAFDMDVPVHVCWWWEESAASPEATTERRRWLGALAAAGWRAPSPTPSR